MQAIKVKATATGAAQRDAMFAAANIQNELTGSRLRQRRVSHYVRHQQSDKQFIHLSLLSLDNCRFLTSWGHSTTFQSLFLPHSHTGIYRQLVHTWAWVLAKA